MSENFLLEQQENGQGSNVMSTAVASEYVRKMVELETSGNGDLDNAMRRIARRYGLNFWQLSHLRAGRAKALTIDAFQGIRGAYLDFCARKIAALQEELSRERAKYGDEPFADLADEASALMAKIQAAKERQRGEA